MICSYECTFCTACSTEMGDVCPNCSGRLVLRPPRAVASEPDSGSLPRGTGSRTTRISGRNLPSGAGSEFDRLPLSGAFRWM